MSTTTKNNREEMYKEISKKKFATQRKLIIKPNIICFIVEAILLVILACMDGIGVIFDSTSILFTVMLIIMTIVPLVSVAIAFAAKTTTHLLVTLSLNQLCIIPLIIAYFLKYEEMKNCSSYHMLIFYFLYMIIYLVMTTVIFNMKSKFTTLEEK